MPSCTVAGLVFTAWYIWCFFWTLPPLLSVPEDFSGEDLVRRAWGRGEAVLLQRVINVGELAQVEDAEARHHFVPSVFHTAPVVFAAG